MATVFAAKVLITQLTQTLIINTINYVANISLSSLFTIYVY